MIHLSAEQVLFVHARVISATGGSHGVRDLAMLESAVGRPRATFEGRELYPDIFSKAAALMDSLINNHPFVDGNKRTGVACAGLFLQLNGLELNADNAEVESFALLVGTSHPDIERIAKWLKKKSASSL
jgi:death-on-curing protein